MSTATAASVNPNPANNVATLPRKELSDFAQRARYEIEEAGKLLQDFGTLSTRGNGKGAYNAAIRIPGESRFVLGGFGAAVVVGFDGTHYEGEINRGLKEVIGVYAGIFQERADINAALHTHSPFLTAHAIAHKPFRIDYWSVAKRAGALEIPLSRWAARYDAEPVVESIRAYPDSPAVLLRNRGLFTWGKGSLREVAALLNSIEEAAEFAVYAAQLGGGQALPEGELEKFKAKQQG
jgi:ribulose-5-phosphate 4-epimerase/fuculose-1-phosphate aldolase